VMAKAKLNARKKIEGRIIRILDGKTVVINLGREHGIQRNSVFYILGEPEKVIDPMTKEELGAVAVNKAKVVASQVFDKFTIAATPFATQDLSALFQTEVNLPVDPRDIKPWKATSESPVKVGDKVEAYVIAELVDEAPEVEA
jgi:hypothetical protein